MPSGCLSRFRFFSSPHTLLSSCLSHVRSALLPDKPIFATVTAVVAGAAGMALKSSSVVDSKACQAGYLIKELNAINGFYSSQVKNYMIAIAPLVTTTILTIMSLAADKRNPQNIKKRLRNLKTALVNMKNSMLENEKEDWAYIGWVFVYYIVTSTLGKLIPSFDPSGHFQVVLTAAQLQSVVHAVETRIKKQFNSQNEKEEFKLKFNSKEEFKFNCQVSDNNSLHKALDFVNKSSHYLFSLSLMLMLYHTANKCHTSEEVFAGSTIAILGGLLGKGFTKYVYPHFPRLCRAPIQPLALDDEKESPSEVIIHAAPFSLSQTSVENNLPEDDSSLIVFHPSPFDMKDASSPLRSQSQLPNHHPVSLHTMSAAL